jgi:hypothetical protein
MPQTQQMITKLLAERQQQQLEPGLSTYPTLKDNTKLTSISPDLLIVHKKKRHQMHLVFSDLSMSTPTFDSSPQSTATLFTCVGSVSDFEPSQCSSESPIEYATSLNELVYLQNASTDADNGLIMRQRFKRSVSDTGDKSQGESENSVHSSEAIESDINGTVEEDGWGCHDPAAVADPLECRRDRSSPLFFLFESDACGRNDF